MATVKGTPTPLPRADHIVLTLTEDEAWDLRDLLGDTSTATLDAFVGSRAIFDALYNAGFTYDGSRARGRI